MKKEYEQPICRTICWNTQEYLTNTIDGEGEDFVYGPLSEAIEEW